MLHYPCCMQAFFVHQNKPQKMIIKLAIYLMYKYYRYVSIKWSTNI